MVRANAPGLFHEVANADGLNNEADPTKTTTSAFDSPTNTGSPDAVASTGSSARVVSFNPINNFPADDRVFSTTADPSIEFTWELENDVTLKAVSWIVRAAEEPKLKVSAKRQDAGQGETGPGAEWNTLITSTYEDDRFTDGNTQVLQGDDRGGMAVTLDFTQAGLSTQSPTDSWREQLNAIRVDWQRGDEPESYSLSPFFSVASSNQDESDLEEMVHKWEEEEKCLSGCDFDAAAVDQGGSGQPAGGDDGAATEPESSGGGGGGGGLSTGAIAGIAVGAVAGLAIIGLLVWFVLRRRRKASRPGKFSGTQQTSDAFITDKAEQGHTADSPRSPYSDDGNHPTHLGSPSGTAAGLAANSTHHGSVADDEARPKFSSYQETRSIEDSAGHQTPQGVSRNVAHLVEDGMTEADIRRLEEEERALDDAIERAGRR